MLNRRVHLGGWEEPEARQGHTFLTPNENAAGTLGITPLSLETLAQQVLGDDRVAHPILVQRLLRGVVEEVLESTDLDGVARTLLPSIRELFRSGADIGVDPGSSRARRVVEVARYYRARLREQGLVDPAEALLEAARSSPSRRPVLVWGYPRLGPAEVALVDAVAGEGSVVYLPYAEVPLFGENLEAAKELQRRGWTVDQDPLSEVWEVKAPVEARTYAHQEAEVRGALAQVKALLTDGVPPQDLVLVAREDAGYGPTVLEVAKEYGVPVQALAGELRAIAVLGEGRSEELPNVPTAKELGYDVSVPVWGAIAAPAETPPQVVEELGRAFVDVSSSRVFRTALRGTGREPTQRGGEGFAEYVEEQSRLLPKDGPEPEVDE